MAKNSDMQLYVNGMQHAYNVVKQSGIEELERELKYRASKPLPLNVSRQELTAVARIRAKEELMIVATAMATTLTYYMKMPPSIIKDYLDHFNGLIDIYRMDDGKLKTDQDRLDKNYMMNQMLREYLEEDKESE